MTLPYTKQNWVDDAAGGTPLSASRLTVIEQGISDAHQMPACRAYHSAAQSVPTNAWTTLALDSELFDVAQGANSNQHDLAVNNSRLTCRYPGIYAICGAATFMTASNTGLRGLNLLLNGVVNIAQELMAAIPTYGHAMTVAGIYQLSVNDYVELQALQSYGFAMNVQGQALMWGRIG